MQMFGVVNWRPRWFCLVEVPTDYAERISDQARGTCNSVMSRIRIYIENMFAGQSTIFNFLSFGKHLRLGGRNVDRLCVTANFLMTVCTCFYGNRMTIASGMRPPLLEELLRRKE